jgi:hypothetical protein
MSKRDERKILHYRWEFVRRNPDFRKELDSFLAKFYPWFQEHGWWYDPEVKYNRNEKLYFRETIEPIERSLLRRWQIETLVPYDWHFDGSGRYELRKGVIVNLSGHRLDMEVRHGAMRRLDEAELEIESKRRTPEYCFEGEIRGDDVPDSYWDRHIYLSVDIGVSVKHAMREFVAEIRWARDEYKKKHGRLPGPRESRPRRRFDQFEEYLRVWDLKQEGLTLGEIAVRLHPGQAAKDRVKDHYRRAKELIGGTYKKLE